MLKQIKEQKAQSLTPRSQTEKRQANHGSSCASSCGCSTALVSSKSKSENVIHLEPDSPINRTSRDVLECVPFRELMDTQRKHSPVMSHRICGIVPFMGTLEDESEKNHYVFQKEEGRLLRKNGMFFCNSPLCLWCETKRRKDKLEEFELVLHNASPEKVFGTFTAKTKGRLGDFADKMTDAFARTMSSLMTECQKLYGEHPLYAKVVEATTNPYKGKNGSVHYHLHFIITFRGKTDGSSNVIRLLNLKWMETFLVDKWAKFGTKVGLVVRKRSQDVRVLGTSGEDVAKIALYLTKGLAMELASNQTKESKTNYSLKTLLALVSKGCEQALRLYQRIAHTLFGKRFLTKSQGWNEFHRELLEQQQEEVSETEVEEEETEVVEMKVARMTYKFAHLSFGSLLDDIISEILSKKRGEDAFIELQELFSVETEWEMIEQEVDEFGEFDERAFQENVRELLLELMFRHRMEMKSIGGRHYSYRTFQMIVGT